MPLRDRLHRRGEMPVPVRRRIGGRRVAGYQDHRQGRPLQREGQQVGRVGQGVGAVGDDHPRERGGLQPAQRVQ